MPAHTYQGYDCSDTGGVSACQSISQVQIKTKVASRCRIGIGIGIGRGGIYPSVNVEVSVRPVAQAAIILPLR